MRIVAGRYRGASLNAPKGAKTRPTSDRVRESVFNILLHSMDGFDIENSRVLDLFAGTGALGLEALSRGARYCLFIENDSDARATIRRNIETLNATGTTKIWRRDATRLGEVGTAGQFDLIFLDPPYGEGLGEKALVSAHEGEWLSQGAICILEEARQSEVEFPDPYRLLADRTYGDTRILFLHYEDGTGSPD